MARKKFEDKHKPKKYGGYIRLSEEDGNNESVSVGNQRKIISQFADENNLELVEFYIDDGFKGYKMSRPDFDRMKEDLEDGIRGADVVFVSDDGLDFSYTVDTVSLGYAKPDAIVLHTLPVSENGALSEDVISSHAFVGLDEAMHLPEIEMAVLTLLIGKKPL